MENPLKRWQRMVRQLVQRAAPVPALLAEPRPRRTASKRAQQRRKKARKAARRARRRNRGQ